MKNLSARNRIAYAESLGMERCQPYFATRIKKPRWYWKGQYYSFHELPELPAPVQR